MNITVTWGKKPTDLVQVTDKLSDNAVSSTPRHVSLSGEGVFIVL
jgi:hypothetical protein